MTEKFRKKEGLLAVTVASHHGVGRFKQVSIGGRSAAKRQNGKLNGGTDDLCLPVYK